MRASARARGGDVGRSSASSSRSQARAGAVPNTLPAPLITAGTSAASSSRWIIAACRWVRTSTATWPGRTGSRSTVAPESSSRTMSAATSLAMCSRAAGLRAYPWLVSSIDGASRRAIRTRSGAGSGAPAKRVMRLASAARTVRYAMPSWPSLAPPNSAS